MTPLPRPSPAPLHRPRESRGFTIIELMVVVSIVAVLAAIAAPSFTPMIERWRMRQAAEGLQSTLYLARSEAIKLGGNVIVEKLPNGTNGCQVAGGNDDWGCGWHVCADTNRSNTCTAADRELQRVDAPSKTLVTRRSGGARIIFNRWGLVDGTWIGFTLVPQGNNESSTNPAAHGVCMSSGGRVRILTSENLPCTNG
jgi:type IV fimbrial biogenesis protein FimT